MFNFYFVHFLLLLFAFLYSYFYFIDSLLFTILPTVLYKDPGSLCRNKIQSEFIWWNHSDPIFMKPNFYLRKKGTESTSQMSNDRYQLVCNIHVYSEMQFACIKQKENRKWHMISVIKSRNLKSPRKLFHNIKKGRSFA